MSTNKKTVSEPIEEKTTPIEDTTKESEDKAMANATSAAGSTRLMYVGPTLHDGRLKTNQVFIGTEEEILADLDEAIKEYPEIKNLLVPVSRAAEVKAKIKTPGNLYNKYSNVIGNAVTARKGGNR